MNEKPTSQIYLLKTKPDLRNSLFDKFFQQSKAMASSSRRGLKVSDENVKLSSNSANVKLNSSSGNVKLTSNSANVKLTSISQKSMPAILSRKRKSDQLEMDCSNFFQLAGSSSQNPWSIFPSDLTIFPISSTFKINNSPEPEEPMLVCSENLPPKSKMTTNKQQTLSVSASRVPLATLSSNTSQGLNHKSSVTLGREKLKPIIESFESSPRSPPTKRLRLSQSWSQFREFVRTTSNDQDHPRGVTPFPEVRWADKQEIWDLICKKERGMYLRQTGEELLARHPCLQPRMRAILFDWLIEVCEVYKLHRETFYLAVDFIDRYLGSTTNMPKTRVQLIGVTCLFIAAKIEEIYPPKLQEFSYVTDGACSEDEILSMELVILKGLNWGLNPMTPNGWIKLYLQVDKTSQIVQINGSNPSGNEDLVLPEFSSKMFSRIMQLLDLCTLDIGSLSFPYSILAASALYHLQDENIALKTSGYTWDEISPCVNWMSPFVFALRESMIPSTPIVQPKSMHNISPENVHNIQVHSVELSVLDRAQQRQELLLEQTSRQSPDLQKVGSHMMSSLEMTPPEEDGDLLDFIPIGLQSDLPEQKMNVSQSSSVFMSPKLEGDFW